MITNRPSRSSICTTSETPVAPHVLQMQYLWMQPNNAEITHRAAVNDPRQHELTFADLFRYVSHRIRSRHSSNLRLSSEALKVKPEQQMHRNNIQIRLAATRHWQPSAIIDCVEVNSGKQVEFTFADLSRCRLHTEWIKDASPSNTGPDFYRTSAADVGKLENFWVSQVNVSSDGQVVSLHFLSKDGSSCMKKSKHNFCMRALLLCLGIDSRLAWSS